VVLILNANISYWLVIPWATTALFPREDVSSLQSDDKTASTFKTSLSNNSLVSLVSSPASMEKIAELTI
jgi:hypothetical protein